MLLQHLRMTNLSKVSNCEKYWDNKDTVVALLIFSFEEVVLTCFWYW